MPTIPLNKLFSYSGVFTDLQDGKITLYVHNVDDSAVEILLDDDSVKALQMARGLIDDLLSRSLVLTGTITRKIVSQTTVESETKTVQVDVLPDQADLDAMQADLAGKVLMKA
jgi:hypothetical protein